MLASGPRPFTCVRNKTQRAGTLTRATNRQIGVDVKSLVAAGFVAASMILAEAPGAQAEVVAQKALESEQSIQTQGQQLEYILQQQAIVKKAQIEAQRQQLSQQKTSVETALQQKITEQRANARAALIRGDAQRSKELEAEAAQLEEQANKVKVAAAKIEAQLSRAEMLERARTVAGQQTIRKAVSDADDGINMAVDQFLESTKEGSAVLARK